jgi:hypothetical protein
VSGKNGMHESQQDQQDRFDPARDALALPREIEAPRGLWTGIEARIAAKERRRVQARRSISGASLLLAAAAVILSVRAARKPREGDPSVAPVASESHRIAPPHAAPSAVEDPTAALLVPEEASYRAALAALAPTFEARKASLPEKDLAQVGASLHALDAAIGTTRAALAEHPEDADLRGELDAEYEQKIDAMNDVLEWTTRS